MLSQSVSAIIGSVIAIIVVVSTLGVPLVLTGLNLVNLFYKRHLNSSF